YQQGPDHSARQARPGQQVQPAAGPLHLPAGAPGAGPGPRHQGPRAGGGGGDRGGGPPPGRQPRPQPRAPWTGPPPPTTKFPPPAPSAARQPQTSSQYTSPSSQARPDDPRRDPHTFC